MPYVPPTDEQLKLILLYCFTGLSAVIGIVAVALHFVDHGNLSRVEGVNKTTTSDENIDQPKAADRAGVLMSLANVEMQVPIGAIAPINRNDIPAPTTFVAPTFTRTGITNAVVPIPGDIVGFRVDGKGMYSLNIHLQRSNSYEEFQIRFFTDTALTIPFNPQESGTDVTFPMFFYLSASPGPSIVDVCATFATGIDTVYLYPALFNHGSSSSSFKIDSMRMSVTQLQS